MHERSIVIARPRAASELVLLFHGVGSSAANLAPPVRRAPQSLRFHLIHGEQDNVVPASSSIDAARALQALGADITLDLLPGLGHGIDARALGLVIGYVGEQGS